MLGFLKRSTMPAAFASRCILFSMMPSLEDEQAKLVDFAHVDDVEFQTLRRKLARWAVDHSAALKAVNPDMPPGFANRMRQNWKVLFAIADVIGGEWPTRLRNAAQKLVPSSDEMSWEKRAVFDLHKIFSTLKDRRDREFGKTTEYVLSAEAYKWLLDEPESPWHDYKGHRLKWREFTHLLAEQGIRTEGIHPTKRETDKRMGYVRSPEMDEIFSRVLQLPRTTSGHPVTPCGSAVIEDGADDRMTGSHPAEPIVSEKIPEPVGKPGKKKSKKTGSTASTSGHPVSSREALGKKESAARWRERRDAKKEGRAPAPWAAKKK
jgi:Protein of unknown function (DUF3631)